MLAPPASITTLGWSDAEMGTSGCSPDAGSPGGPSRTKPMSTGMSRLALLSLLRVRGSKRLVPMGYLNTNRGYIVLQCLSKHWEL